MLLKALHNKVNLIPVIAKADTITPAELEASGAPCAGRALAAR